MVIQCDMTSVLGEPIHDAGMALYVWQDREIKFDAPEL